MQSFSLDGRSHITLNNLLKIEGWCESGGFAKQMIAAGYVKVNGEVELRKRCKITDGQIVEFEEQEIQISQ